MLGFGHTCRVKPEPALRRHCRHVDVKCDAWTGGDLVPWARKCSSAFYGGSVRLLSSVDQVLGDCRSDHGHCNECPEGSVASSSGDLQFLATPLQKGSDRQLADALPVASTNPVTRGFRPHSSPPSPPSSPILVYTSHTCGPTVLGPSCSVINDRQNPRRCSGTSRPPRRPQDHLYWCYSRSLDP